MIEIKRKIINGENLLCPCIICDTCGKEIIKNGLVICFDGGKKGLKKIKFVHKGICDDKNMIYSFELKTFLKQLNNNFNSNE